MARQRRKLSKSHIYHVMMRGNERKEIFKDREDREKFLVILKDKKETAEYDLYAYCLMDNHIHLLIKENKEMLSTVMKRINVSYAYYFNKKYNRVGHVFQDRYKSEPIENDKYLLAAIRYIHNNPKKARKIEKLKDYQWSSYKEYISYNATPELVEREWILSMFSPKLEHARKNFIKFSKEANNHQFIDIEDKLGNVDIEIKGLLEARTHLYDYLKSKHLTLGKINNSCNKEERDNLIRDLRIKSNLSIRDIAKLLNVNRGTVNRVRV